ncbi:MAG: hypothetical protein V1809_08915 [Planctomycetota bacterium]
MDYTKTLVGDVEWFVTIQRFKAPACTPGEPHWCGLFFDLDGDLETTRREALMIADFFTKGFGVEPIAIRLSFSGGKGFHIVVEPEVLGIIPHPRLTYAIKAAAFDVKTILGLTTMCPKVYSSRRMWRLEGSRHGKSGFYCVELPHSALRRGIDHVLAIARTPLESLYPEEEYAALEGNPEAAQWMRSFLKDAVQCDSCVVTAPTLVNFDIKDTPVCVRDLLDRHIRVHGDRNNATLVLVCAFKDMGIPWPEAVARITEWACRTPQHLTSTHARESYEKNAKSVVAAVYGNARYRFLCGAMMNLGDAVAGRPPCNYRDCKFIHARYPNIYDRNPYLGKGVLASARD